MAKKNKYQNIADEECKQAVRENRIPNCIIIEELKMLEKHIENS